MPVLCLLDRVIPLLDKARGKLSSEMQYHIAEGDIAIACILLFTGNSMASAIGTLAAG